MMEKQKNEIKIYYYKHPTSVYVFYGIMCALFLLGGLYNLMKVLGVGTLVSYYRGLEIASVAVCFLALIFVTAFLFCNRYEISSNTFIYRKLTRTEYSADKLLTIKRDKKSGLTVLYVEDENKEDYVGFIVLSVFPSKADKIIEDIQKLNSHVSVEVVDNDE